MVNGNKYWWVVTGDKYPDFTHWNKMKKGNFVSLGWDLIRDLENCKNLGDTIKEQCAIHYPEKKSKDINKKLLHFVRDARINHIVVVCQGTKTLGIGKITGSYFYEDQDNDYKHRIPVEWLSFDTQDILFPTSGHSNLSTFYEIDKEKYSKCISKILQKIPAIEQENSNNLPSLQTFDPEFTGKYSYTHKDEIKVYREHGIIVNSLEDELKRREYTVGNTPEIDLLISSSNSSIQAIFEVKTDTKPYDIYCAIGQLIFHSSSLNDEPKKIVVLPDFPDEKTLNIFKKLDIGIIDFEKTADGIIFHGLDELLK